MVIGYARVSTHEQNLSLQLDAFKKAKCARVFQEHISSGSKSRPELAAALDVLREGDTLMVWRLDRLGRNMRELDDLITQFKKQGIRFSSLTEAIDTSTASGKLYFHIIAAFAEYEREGIRERTQAGVTAARARGRKGGGNTNSHPRSEPWSSTPTTRRPRSVTSAISSGLATRQSTASLKLIRLSSL